MFRPALLERAAEERPDIPVPRTVPLMPYCVNLVLTCSVNVTIDLRDLVRKLPFLVYNKLAFASAIGHFESPQITYRVSSSGMMVIAGGKNMYTAMYAAKNFVDLIRGEHPLAHVTDMRIQNLTCVVHMGFKIDVTRCSAENAGRCVFHAGIFPGMRMKSGVKTIRLIVFFTGNIVITGAKNEEEAQQSIMAVIGLLHEYALPMDTPPPPKVQRAKRRRGNKPEEPAMEPEAFIESVVQQLQDAEVEAIMMRGI